MIPQAVGGRPVTGRDCKRLLAFHPDVSGFLSAEKVRTGKNLNRIVEDLLRLQMKLSPNKRHY